MNEALRKLIRELVEQELEEVSTSAGAGPYNTPYAFRGNSAAGKAKEKKNAEQAGYEIVKGKSEKAQDVGDSEERTVEFGDKGTGGLKKPKKEKVVQEETDGQDIQTQINHAQSMIQKSHNRVKYSRAGTSERDEATEAKKYWKDRLADLQKKKSSISESRYTDFKMSEGTPSQKIGRAIREINRQITEVDRLLRMNERLKQESGINSDQLWKSTARGLTKLEGKLNTLNSRLRNLRA